MLFSKMGEATFTTSSYNNWKKALEKFNHYENCNTHQGAVMKWTMIKNTPPINEQLSILSTKGYNKADAMLLLSN